ncbi:uncharacterized protein LOC125940374 isoform X2 [Dermacentor silvarum]|uniref:uncharacterized protein LOC125940374 isoform X2 n=1 Tax=Dermacentor silvarum TaxID=543639 RepID=UPI002100FB20|nr:uncharacterized protein LOC125940374 isoform X2 [Dermacentor silvarum]
MEFVHHLVIVTLLICEAFAANYCAHQNEEFYYCKSKGEKYPQLCPQLHDTCGSIGEQICVCKEGYFRWDFWEPCVTWRECVLPTASSYEVLEGSETLFLTKASGTVFTNLVRCFKSSLIFKSWAVWVRTVEFQQRTGTLSHAETDSSEGRTEDMLPPATKEETALGNDDASLNASRTYDEMEPCIWCSALRPSEAPIETEPKSIDGSINSRSLVQTGLETVPWFMRQSVKPRSSLTAIKTTNLKAFMPTLSRSTIFCTRMRTASLLGKIRHQDK